MKYTIFKKIIDRYRPHDKDFKKMLFKWVGSFLVRVFGGFLSFFTYFYLARLLGAAGFGLFSLSFTIVSILAVFSRLGLDTFVIREVAKQHNSQMNGNARCLVASILRVIFPVTVIVLLLLVFLSGIISNRFFNKPELAPVLVGMAPIVLFYVGGYILGEAFKGIRYTTTAIMLQYTAHPLLFLVIVFGLSPVIKFCPESSAILYSVISIPIFILALYYWHRITIFDSQLVLQKAKELVKKGFPMLLMATGSLMLSWTDVLVLGIFVNEESIGIYSAASRTALATSLVLISVNAIIAPQFSHCFSNADFDGLKRLAKLSTRLMIMIVSFPTLFLLIFPVWTLSLFGDEFTSGAPILIILTIGQFVNVACGSVGYMLVMSNNERIMQKIILVTALINLVLSVVAVNVYGVIGVALSTALCTAFWNIWALIEVKRKFGHLMFL